MRPSLTRLVMKIPGEPASHGLKKCRKRKSKNHQAVDFWALRSG